MSKKSVILGFIFLISATAALFFWGFWKFYNVSGSINYVWLLLLLGPLMLSLLGLFAYFNENIFLSLVFSVVISLPVLILDFSRYTLIAFFLLVTATVILNIRAGILKKSLLKQSVYRSLSGISLTYTLLCAALAVTYFPFALQASQNYKIILPQQIFEQIYSNLTKQFSGGTNVNPNASNNLAEANFESQIPQIRVQLLSQGISDETQINEQINLIRKQYLEQVKQNGGALNSEDPELTKQAIKSSVESQLNNLLTENRKFLPLILSVSLFLSITLISSIITFLTLTITNLYVWLMLKIGLAKVVSQTVEIKKIVI